MFVCPSVQLSVEPPPWKMVRFRGKNLTFFFFFFPFFFLPFLDVFIPFWVLFSWRPRFLNCSKFFTVRIFSLLVLHPVEVKQGVTQCGQTFDTSHRLSAFSYLLRALLEVQQSHKKLEGTSQSISCRWNIICCRSTQRGQPEMEMLLTYNSDTHSSTSGLFTAVIFRKNATKCAKILEHCHSCKWTFHFCLKSETEKKTALDQAFQETLLHLLVSVSWLRQNILASRVKLTLSSKNGSNGWHFLKSSFTVIGSALNWLALCFTPIVFIFVCWVFRVRRRQTWPFARI